MRDHFKYKIKDSCLLHRQLTRYLLGKIVYYKLLNSFTAYLKYTCRISII